MNDEAITRILCKLAESGKPISPATVKRTGYVRLLEDIGKGAGESALRFFRPFCPAFQPPYPSASIRFAVFVF